MNDDEIAAERSSRGFVALTRSARIVLERLVRMFAKKIADQIGEGPRAVARQRKIEALVLRPARHQRDVALFTRGEDVIGRARQKPSIDDRAESESWRPGEDRFAREGAQLGQRLRPKPAHKIEA